MTKLLVADDAPFIREIVRLIAHKNSIELVGEAVDGEEAVELALRTRPDVILMDIVMPKKSGIEAAREIVAAMPGAKVIAFSTADQDTLAMRAIEAGCCSFLAKPFTSEDLLAAIRSSLDAQAQV